MTLNKGDLRVYECPNPDCKKTGTYNESGFDGATKQIIFECSNCGRKRGEESLETEIREND